MPAPPLSNNYTGTDTVVIDTTNSASGGDAFSLVNSAQVTYSTTQAHSASTSMKLVVNTGVPAPNGTQWSSLGSITTDVYVRFYLYLPALPSDNNFYPLALRTSADAASALIRILADGSAHIRDASNSQALFIAGALATGQWIRMEARVATGAGTCELRYYASADSTSITQSQTASGITFGANNDRVNLGMNTATTANAYTVYFDDFAVATAGWIGPTSSGILGPTSWLGAIG